MRPKYEPLRRKRKRVSHHMTDRGELVFLAAAFDQLRLLQDVEMVIIRIALKPVRLQLGITLSPILSQLQQNCSLYVVRDVNAGCRDIFHTLSVCHKDDQQNRALA